jgi:hypothetical protein
MPRRRSKAEEMVVGVAVGAAAEEAEVIRSGAEAEIRRVVEEVIRSVAEEARKGAAGFRVVAVVEPEVKVIERVSHRNEAAIIRMVEVPLHEADTRTAIRGAVAHVMPGAAILLLAGRRAREVM